MVGAVAQMEAAVATEVAVLVPAEAVPHLLPPDLVATAVVTAVVAQRAQQVVVEAVVDLRSTTRPG